MLLQIACAVLTAAAAGAAADAAYRAEIEAWRVKREARLKADDGWLTVTGLFWLKDGPNLAGSDPASEIRLPATAPGRAGVFVAESGRVAVRLEKGVAATLAGQPVTEAELRPDSPDVLTLGRVSLLVIERGGRRAIRMRDLDSPARTAFKGLDWFEVDEAYRVVAKVVPQDPPQAVRIVNILGQVVEMPSPGVAVFRLAGRELRLTPVLESPDADELFFIFRDETSGRDSYGAGRYLYTPLPVNGEVVLDFNKAYSPPCAFTEYATCPLPPLQNRLPLRIEAGERMTVHRTASVPRFGETLDVTGDAPGEARATLLPVQPRQVLGVAGGADNVFRTLQTLPGVAAVDEFASRLSVRGGGPDENLTVMDGVEIHNPYRLFGLASAFNPETVERFELSAGGFGARHGDRLSSLLIVENRSGNVDRRLAGSSALSLTDANVILEGGLPGPARGAWLATGRRTYYDLVAERFVGQQLPAFADMQLKAHWEPRPGQRLSLLGLRSREDTDAVFDDDGDGESGDFLARASNELAALDYRAALSSRTTARSIASWYTNRDFLDVAARFRSENRRSNTAGEGGAGLADIAFDRELSVRDLALRQEVSVQASARHALEAGFELHRLHTGVSFVTTGDRNPTAANGSSVLGGAGLPDALDSKRSATRAGAWLQDRFAVAGRLTLEPGVRLDWSGVNGRATLSPRLAVGVALDDSTRLRAAGGVYTQSPGYEKLHQADYFIDLTAAGRLDLASERAVHAVVGLERQLPGGFTARIEAYYKRLDDLLIGRLETEEERRARLAAYDFSRELLGELPSDPLITSFPTNDGRGRSWGFDLYLARAASGAESGLSGWLAYTFGHAERDAYGRTYPFEYDRRHALSVVALWPATGWLDVSATARVASGFPRTPAVGVRVSGRPDAGDSDKDGDLSELVPERDSEGRLVYVVDLGGVENLNSARLPVFARLDLRLTFRPRWSGGRWQFYLDLINALDRENAGILDPRLEHDPDSGRPRIREERVASIPFLPSIGVRFRF